MPDAQPQQPALLRRRALAYALSLTHDEQAAEDLLQEAWVSVLRCNGPQNFGYLRAAIRSRFLDARRRALHAPLADGGRSEAVVHTDPADAILARQALQTLGADERDVLVMNAVQGFTAQEIGDMTARPRGTVLSMLHRSRKKVLAALAAAAVVSLILMLARTDSAPSTVDPGPEREIAANHLKNEPVVFATDRFDQLAALMPRLDFVPVEPEIVQQRGLTLLGARYCTLVGNVAAQLRMVDREGRRVTIYQARDGAAFRQLTSRSNLVDGVQVHLSRQDGVLVGIAE